MNTNQEFELGKIMPLGDSITYDNDLRDCETPRPTGDRLAYRYDLYALLRHAGYSFSFVGNRDAGFHHFSETKNAGFPGCTVKQLCELLVTGYNGFEKKQELVLRKEGYLQMFKPDIILLHIGTNHVDKTRSQEFAELLDIIQDYRESENEREITVFVARIIDYQIHNPSVTEFNKRMDEMVMSRKTRGEIYIPVDMEQALNYGTDMADMYHPNPAGYSNMAKKWFEALTNWHRNIKK